MKNKKVKAVIIVAAFFAGMVQMASAQNLPPPNLGGSPKARSARPADPAQPIPSGGDTAGLPAKPLPPVSIEAKVDRTQFPQNETVTLSVVVSWEQSAKEPGLPLDFEFPDPPRGEGLVLFSNCFNSETELSGTRVKIKRIYSYQFRAEDQGQTRIEPVKLNYFRAGSEDKKPLSTQAIPVTVTGPRIKPGEFLRRAETKVALALLVVICAAVLAWMLIRSRKKQKPELPPAVSRHEIARQRLQEADRLRMAGDYNAYLKSLSREMRSYLEDVMDVKARGLKPEKLAQSVSEKLGADWKEKILNLEKLCDKTAFAGYAPQSAELNAAMHCAKGIITEGEKKYPENSMNPKE